MLKAFSAALVLFAIALTLPRCSREADVVLTIEEEHTLVCGSCHLVVDPQDIPKNIWDEHVLPNMAARVGLAYGDYRPLKGLSMQEEFEVQRTGTYPRQPTIDSALWWRVRDYIVALAPDSIPVDTSRMLGVSAQELFAASTLRFNEQRASYVTGVTYQNDSHQFIVSDIQGGLTQLPANTRLAQTGQGPVVGFSTRNGDTLLTQIGGMDPTQIATGSILRIGSNGATTRVASELHRPVHTQVADLDADGRDELIVCEFGYYTGAVSLLTLEDSTYVATSILDLPGTIKTEVTDLNGDGHLDIIALASQGQEGIYALYGDGQLNFRREALVRHPPHWGTSWFELVDIDGDADLDLVIANGDNADYSIFAKPYHGVRVYTNDGSANYSPSYFYPMYGATRVAVSDFDGDGDADIAATAFFPDYSRNTSDGFVLLEQVGGQTQFTPRSLAEAGIGRWLVMDAGDMDSDGDTDLVLGSLPMPTGATGRAVYQGWLSNVVDALILENTSK